VTEEAALNEAMMMAASRVAEIAPRPAADVQTWRRVNCSACAGGGAVTGWVRVARALFLVVLSVSRLLSLLVGRRLWRMNEAHVVAVATIFQCFLLFANACLFVWYLTETRMMRKAAERQAEAIFQPAVVAVPSDSLDGFPELVNIGSGPAIDVRWVLRDMEHAGVIPYLRPGASFKLGIPGAGAMYEAAGKGNTREAFIDCEYRSVSGMCYESENVYDTGSNRFNTIFGVSGPTSS